jgi:hypothetical protein
MHSFKAQRHLRIEMLPVMSMMTPPNIVASSTLAKATTALTAAGAVVVHEFLWFVSVRVLWALSNLPPFGGDEN